MATPEQNDPTRDLSMPPKLHVLFPTGNRNDYEITNETNVSDLIQMIADDKTVQKPENRTIALIYHGRILQPTDVLSKIDTMSEFTIHACFRQTSSHKRSHKHKNEHQSTQNETNSTTEENRDNNNQENNDDDERLASDLRGFDRLTRMNYTPEQIAEIRRSFHTMQGSLNASPEAQIEAEEEWFPVIFNTNIVDGRAAGAARILLGIANGNNDNNIPFNIPTRHHRNRQNTNNGENQENDDNYDYDEQEGTRENDPENPANHRTANRWAIFNDDNTDAPPDDNDGSSWIRFAFGFIIGIIFGIGSILFMLTSLNDRSMLAGLFVGTLSHYCITRFFESSS